MTLAVEVLVCSPDDSHWSIEPQGGRLQTTRPDVEPPESRLHIRSDLDAVELLSDDNALKHSRASRAVIEPLLQRLGSEISDYADRAGVAVATRGDD